MGVVALKKTEIVSFVFCDANTLSKIDNGCVKADGFEPATCNFSLKVV